MKSNKKYKRLKVMRIKVIMLFWRECKEHILLGDNHRVAALVHHINSNKNGGVFIEIICRFPW